MSGKPPDIYLLPEYANQKNLERKASQIAETYEISFTKGGAVIRLSETNSKVENRYSMNIHSAKYLAEGKTVAKEAMIHNHPQGHADRHLQFKLVSGYRKIRIILEFLDIEDYKRCIKGFIYISKGIIEFEKIENKISEDLKEYFFNDRIEELAGERLFLLEKIKSAFESGKFLDDASVPVGLKELNGLKNETHLLPFLEWES